MNETLTQLSIGAAFAIYIIGQFVRFWAAKKSNVSEQWNESQFRMREVHKILTAVDDDQVPRIYVRRAVEQALERLAKAQTEISRNIRDQARKIAHLEETVNRLEGRIKQLQASAIPMNCPIAPKKNKLHVTYCYTKQVWYNARESCILYAWCGH